MIAGLVAGAMSVAVLAAGTEAAAEVAAEDTSAFADALQAVVNVLPWPWNAVGGAVIAAGTAIFAWRKAKKKKEPEEKNF